MSVSICHTDHPDHSRIADWLLLNGTLTACPGLLHGKLGIAIFFFHYARFTGEELFDEYAWDLVVAMQEQLHANYRPDYEWGIAGIGVGIDYLIRSGLIEVDEDFFEDLDERMYRAVMYDPYPDYSRDEGLTGYGWYWLCRRANAGVADCLSRIAARIEQDQVGFSPGEIRDAARFLRAYAGHPDPVDTLVETDWERLAGAGLAGGYAGAGLESLSLLGTVDTSWRLLL